MHVTLRCVAYTSARRAAAASFATVFNDTQRDTLVTLSRSHCVTLRSLRCIEVRLFAHAFTMKIISGRLSRFRFILQLYEIERDSFYVLQLSLCQREIVGQKDFLLRTLKSN